ncbi:MAG: diphthine synthase [Candidatus Thalassarchaeaceae archaeon]|nr:diphthine synthase [Candidatus Thalassarchaeaceae archaeon]
MGENGLWLIGLGPGDLQQMTVAALAAARDADHRFLEGYTALLPPNELENMGELIGSWEMRMRSAVEEPHDLLSLAQSSKVALLIVGDPLQATTHVDLQIRCGELGIPCHVEHGISITTIVTGAVGLQSYRFGRQCTFAYPYGEYLPTSPLEIVLANRERDLHTLALLDLDPSGMGEGEQQPMTPEGAIDVLRKMAEKLEIDVEDWMIVLCSDMGTDDARISVGSPTEISEVKGGRIHCLLVPASLHDVEATALARW